MTPRSQSFARCLSLMPMCTILRLCGQSSDVKQWQELGMVNIPLLPWMKVCKRPICYNGQTQKLKKMIVTLGSFHTQATFTKVIRKYLELSGMFNIWVEWYVFGKTTATNKLKGKLWDCDILAHKLSFEVLWRVLWPLLIKWTQEKGENADATLVHCSAKLAIDITSGEDNSAMDTT